MATIYLIRHGQTTDNNQNRFCGYTDSKLSDLGLSQLVKLSSKFKSHKFNKVYTSPLKRAVLTANQISKEVIRLEGLKEINFGDFEGLSLNEIKESYFCEYEKLMSQNETYNFPNGESLSEFSERIKKTLKYILINALENEDIAIVSHSGVIRCLLSQLLCDNDSLKWNFQIDNCSITKLTYRNKFAVINYMNSTEHLG